MQLNQKLKFLILVYWLPTQSQSHFCNVFISERIQKPETDCIIVVRPALPPPPPPPPPLNARAAAVVTAHPIENAIKYKKPGVVSYHVVYKPVRSFCVWDLSRDKTFFNYSLGGLGTYFAKIGLGSIYWASQYENDPRWGVDIGYHFPSSTKLHNYIVKQMQWTKYCYWKPFSSPRHRNVYAISE